MPVWGAPRQIPYACQLANDNEICVAYNVSGQGPFELADLHAGLFASGMYRIFGKNRQTGELRYLGGCTDVGTSCIDFIPGYVIESKIVDDSVYEDPFWKKFIAPVLFIASAAVLVISAFKFYQLIRK